MTSYCHHGYANDALRQIYIRDVFTARASQKVAGRRSKLSPSCSSGRVMALPDREVPYTETLLCQFFNDTRACQ